MKLSRVATAAVLLITAATVTGQRGRNSDIGKRPSEVLDPKTVRSLQTPLVVQRIETEQQATDRQISRLSGQMQTVVEQLQQIAKNQSQIVTNTQAVTDLERRVAAIEERVISDEKAGATDPANIAVLATKVDGLVKVGGWLIGTTATLAVSGIIFLIKRLRSGAVVTMKWAEQDARVQDRSRSVISSKLDEAIQKSDAAYEAANEVNAKIESIGVHMNDNRPLSQEGDHDEKEQEG